MGSIETVFVTGGSGGLGSAVASAFGADGCHVVLAARDREALESTAADVERAGGTAAVAPLDVRDEDAVFEAFAEHGPVDVLVPCAGVIDGTPGEMALTDATYEEFDEIVETNVRGLFATLREGLQFVAEDGCVLVPSGKVAREPHERMGVYAVSKAADEGLVRGFAADATQTVGLVEPGLVATNLTGGKGRNPEDVAEMFVWAATDCPAEDLDGQVVGLREWKAATR